MGNIDIESINVGVSETARIVGLTNPNLISVWINRGFVKPDQISVLSDKKKFYGFSFKNLIELRLLVELNETFKLGYKLASRILQEAFGPDRQRLAMLTKGGGGYLVIGKSYELTTTREYWDITSDETKKLRKNEAFQVNLLKNRLEIEKISAESDYVMVVDVKKVIERVKKRL